MPVKVSKSLIVFTAVIALIASAGAFAAGSHDGGHDDGDAAGHSEGHGLGHSGAFAFGEPGQADDASRTIAITMGDNFFEPEKLEIEAGETIRFVIENQGEFLHEFNIGMAATHAEHQKEMMVMMEHGMLTPTGIDHEMMKMDHNESGMSGHAHDDPNSVLLEPGKTQELVWTFAKATGLEFACNVPGHYDAGMMGDIEFVEKGRTGG